MAKQDDKELTTDDKFMMLLEVLSSRQEAGIGPETIKELLAGQATAMQKALKPENTAPPMFSAMAHVQGDRDMPRDTILTHEFLYNNFPVRKFPESHTYRELALAEQVRPGEYTCIRKDGSVMTVTVTGEYDAKQVLTKAVVTFPISREEKWLVPPMLVVLYQLVHPDAPRRRFMEAMQEYLQMTMGVDEPVTA